MTERRAADLTYDEIVEIVGRPDPLILELGANNGHHTRMFLGEFQGVKLHCFEPDPRAIAKWRGFIKDPRAVLHEMAIGAETGTATFNMSDGREAEYEGGYYGAGSLRRPKSNQHAWLRFERTLEVKVNRLDDWADQNIPSATIDFIWVDIQGAEVDLIAGGQKTLKRTRWLYTEFSDSEGYVGQIPLSKIAELLADDFEIECVFPGDVLLRNKHLEPKSPRLTERGTVLTSENRTARDPSVASYRCGSDGVFVKILGGQTHRQGKDGRIVPFENGCSYREGKDGRVVAIPAGYTHREGRDGRIVAIPRGCSFREGGDGRIVVIQPGNSPRQGRDGRIIEVGPGARVVEDESGRLSVIHHP